MFQIFSKIILFFILLTSIQLQAQSGLYNNGMGLDRSIGSGSRYNTPRKTESIDYVKATVENMTKELKLDGFQNAILKNIIEEYKNTATAVTLEDIPNEAKFEKIKIEKIKMENRITEMLNDDQKVLFENLKNKGKKKKDKKKKESEEEQDNELF